MQIHWLLQTVCSDIRCILTALNILAEGVLSTPMIDPVTLQKYIATIEDELIADTNYELVFKDIYEFYAHKLVTFTNFAGMLLLQLPVLIKLKVQVPQLIPYKSWWM